MWEQVREVVDPSTAAVATIVLAVTTGVLALAFVVRRQAPAS
jgi:ABC-type spermidine/putrescine transport system permease subunit II